MRDAPAPGTFAWTPPATDTARWAALAAIEGREQVAAAAASLLALERAAADGDVAGAGEALDAVFRAVHSVKGMGAAMEYPAVVTVAHAAEDLLVRLRERAGAGRLVRDVADAVAHDDASDAGELALDLPINLLLAAADALHDAVEESAGGAPGPSAAAIDALVARMRSAAADRSITSPPGGADSGPRSSVSPSAGAGAGAVTVHVRLEPDTLLPGARAAVALGRARTLGTVSDVAPPEGSWAEAPFDGAFGFRVATEADDAQIERTLRLAGDVADVRVTRAPLGVLAPIAPGEEGGAAPSAAPDASARPSGPAPGATATRQVRLDASHLDALLDLVGELGTARSRLSAAAAGIADRTLTAAIAEVARATAALQVQVLESRLAPVAEVFDRMPRVVRDAARATGRSVALHVTGGDVTIDRAMLDGLAEPLGHLLRNAVDHGIEPPDTRVRAGKAPTGRVTLRAWRERDVVLVEVADDGRGVDRAAVMRLARERGVHASPGGAWSSDGGSDPHGAALLALLASPGLSTAARVSAVSGRGVGLDAALARVRQLGGTLTLRTAPGAGMAFTLRLPVTLAVMRVLLVRDGALTCAVPVSHVRETLDAPPEHAAGDAAPDGEHDSSGRRLVRSRGARVPVVTLGAALAGGSGADRPTGTGAGEIVVVDAEGAAVGLHVDAVLAQREVVVKPFPRPRGALRISSGATILEDGAVAPILDVPALLQHLAR